MNNNFLSHAVRSLICMGLSFKAKDLLQDNTKIVKKLIGVDIYNFKKSIVILALFFGIVVY